MPMTYPRIAITNILPENAGPDTVGTAFPLKSAIQDFVGKANIINANFREIIPAPYPNIQDIYTNEIKLREVFKIAKQKAKQILENADCLVVSGNSKMVDPRLFGKPLHENEDKDIDLERAIAELALIHIAMQKGMPILGVCGGHQLLNVHLGGTVDDLGEEDLRNQSILNYEKIHCVPHSELAEIINYSKDSINVKLDHEVFGFHYQVVTKLGGEKMINDQDGNYLEITAVARDKTNNIEAVQSRHGAPIIGVQFHPEIALKGFLYPDLDVAHTGVDFPREAFKANSTGQSINKKIFAVAMKAAETYARKKLLNSQHLSSKKNDYTSTLEGNPEFTGSSSNVLSQAQKTTVNKLREDLINKQIEKINKRKANDDKQPNYIGSTHRLFNSISCETEINNVTELSQNYLKIQRERI